MRSSIFYMSRMTFIDYAFLFDFLDDYTFLFDFLDLKNHPYFDGIDWEKVAARESEPPYEPSEFHYNLGDPVDLETELKMQTSQELEPSVAEKFKSMSELALHK